MVPLTARCMWLPRKPPLQTVLHIPLEPLVILTRCSFLANGLYSGFCYEKCCRILLVSRKCLGISVQLRKDFQQRCFEKGLEWFAICFQVPQPRITKHGCWVNKLFCSCDPKLPDLAQTQGWVWPGSFNYVDLDKSIGTYFDCIAQNMESDCNTSLVINWKAEMLHENKYCRQTEKSKLNYFFNVSDHKSQSL